LSETGLGPYAIPQPKNARCVCEAGFVGRPPTRRPCKDFDECSSILEHECPINTKCVNTFGSYTCEPGCGQYASLINGQCQCDPGFEAWPSDWGPTKGCSDVNECDTNPCPADSECNNQVGYHTCDKCKDNEEVVDGQCECKAGFKRQFDGYCADLDECDDWTSPCATGQLCRNTYGSFECVDQCNSYEVVVPVWHARKPYNTCVYQGGYFRSRYGSNYYCENESTCLRKKNAVWFAFYDLCHCEDYSDVDPVLGCK
jgi:Calcium-binding EGF domain